MELPYGYVLINGEIVAHEGKADVVRSIFTSYLAGASLGRIVDMLDEKESPLHLVTRNGAERRWTNSYLMRNIFPLSAWRHIWMLSFNGNADVTWITTRLTTQKDDEVSIFMP